MVHNIIAAAQSSDSLLPLYYISAIIVSVGTAIWALSRWYEKQRQKWQNEAVHDASITEELNANADATRKNTEAIGKLTSKMDGFVGRVDSDLNGHNNRITRLEDAQFGPYFRGRHSWNNPDDE